MKEKRAAGPSLDRLTYVSERDFETQMEILGLTPEELPGKHVLVLGPGKDWALERGARKHGVALVVGYSIDFSKHDPLRTKIDQKIIKPVLGTFRELPPGNELFDLVVSSYGFPQYAPDSPDDIQNLPDYFSSAIDLIAKGGKGVFFPVRPHEQRALEQLAERRTDFTYRLEFGERLVIEKL